MSAPCPTLGFTVSVELRPAAGADARALTDSLAGLLEAEGLVLHTRAADDRRFELVVTREGSQATDADRERVVVWSRDWHELAWIIVSDLTDLSEPP